MARAPVRVADVGGWTDTWFAARGAVCSVAVGSGAECEVRVRPGAEGDPVRMWAPDLGAAWTVGSDPHRGWSAPRPGHQPLLDHAVAQAVGGLAPEALGPDGVGLDITVSASVPPGSAVGTSASVLVALVAAVGTALDRPPEPAAAARAAFEAETQRAGRESGVQDHIAAAHGGFSWIEIDPYPSWSHAEVLVPPAARTDLVARLITVHLGGGHDSSALHGAVIERAEAGDPGVHMVLAELRDLAALARDHLTAGDLPGWATTLTAATEAQARLHPALVGDDARALLDLAATYGALGGKVNGAGGAGGTVTLLGPEDPDAQAGLVRAVVDADHGWQILDLRLASGLEVDVDRGPEYPFLM